MKAWAATMPKGRAAGVQEVAVFHSEAATMRPFQGDLPFNPTGRAAVSPQGAFNTAVSFMTNTN